MTDMVLFMVKIIFKRISREITFEKNTMEA